MKRLRSEFDEAVLTHVTRYPGLSSYEIARAIGLTYTGRYVNKPKVEQALMRLFLDRVVSFEMVRWSAPGGFKRVWTGSLALDPTPPVDNVLDSF